MSRSTTRSRISLLASSSFVAANILAGAGALMATSFAPSVALAACNPDGAVVANPAAIADTCAGTDATVSYTGVTHKFDVILDGEKVTTGGIAIVSGTGQNLGITDVLNPSTINSNASGVFVVTTAGGNLKVDFSDPIATTKITAANDGIVSAGNNGTNTVLLGVGSTTSGASGVGLAAENNGTGAVTVVNDGTVLDGGVTAWTDGTLNYSGKGDITNNHGVGLRLETFTNGAAETINATVDGAIKSSSTGIIVGLGGSFAPTGATTITTKAVTSTGGDGINIFTNGSVDLTTNGAVSGGGSFGVSITGGNTGGIVYNANASVTGAKTGINVSENSTGNASVKVGAAGATVTGTTGTGIKLNVDNGVGNITTVAATAVTGVKGIDVTVGGGALNAGADVNIGGAVTGTAGNAVTLVDTSNGFSTFTGAATSVITSTGGDGVNYSSTAGANESVATGGAITTNGDFNAIKVSNVGKGKVTVTTGATSTLTSGAGGIVTTADAGATSITVGGAVNADSNNNNSGNGIDATSVTGTINVNVKAAGSIGGDAQIGVNALVTGVTAAGDVITVKNDGAIGSAGNVIDTFGIAASVSNGASAGNIKITGAGTIDAVGSGILATNSGSGSTTIDYDGAITTTTFDGIFGGNNGGDLTITTGPGAIKGGAHGVEASNSGSKGAGNITVNIGGDISGGTFAGNSDGIHAISTGTGLVTVDAVGAGTVSSGAGTPSDGISAKSVNATTGAVTVDLSGAVVNVTGSRSGIVASAIGSGDVNVTTSTGGLITAGTGNGVDARSANGGGTASGNVAVNGGEAITVTGAGDGIVVAADTGNLTVGSTGGGYAGAIDPQGGGNGIKAEITNAASAGNVSVTTAAGGTISGNATIGILATTLGSGSVTVDQAGAIGTAGNKVGANGITAHILSATNTKDVNVAVKGDISSDNHGAFAVTDGLGSVKIDQTAGNVSSGNIGLDGFISNAKNVAGNVTVNTSAGTTVTAGTYGVVAQTNGEGDAAINNAGTVNANLNDGLWAGITGPGLPTSDGSVTVVNTGSTTSTNASGIHAETNSNDEVAVTNSGAAKGATFGISATNTGIGGGVTVTQTGGSTTQTGAAALAGINAQITAAGNSDQTWVNVTGGTVTANGNGIFAQTAGTGLVKVDVGAGVTVTGTNGDGVDAIALGGGNAIVNNAGTINGDPGIVISAVGSGTATTNSSGVVSAVGDGIKSTTVNGANTVNITGTGTVTSTGANGINALSTGSATIDIKTSAGSKITSTGGTNGIFANQTGSGIVTIQALGQIDAGSNGVLAQTTNGTINILTGAGKITGGNTSAGDGIGAAATGANNVTVTTGSGAVGTLTPATAWGVAATSNGGDVAVNIGSGGIFDGGVVAITNGAGATSVKAGGDVVDTAGIGILATADTGPVTVTLNAGKSITSSLDGILATTTTGPIQVTGNAGSSIVSSAGNGINANATAAGGTVLITENGSIDTTPGGLVGINATTAGGIVQVFTGPGTIKGQTGGINAVAGGANDVTVQTGSGAVSGNTGTGINATTSGGNANVTTGGATSGKAGINAATSGAGTIVVTTNGATSSTAGDAIKATTTGSGTVTVNSNATVAAVGGIGINASGTSGKVTVNANADVTGDQGGIQAEDTTGNVFVFALGNVDGGAGNGIKAESLTGNGNVTVNAAGTVKGATGVFTTANGTGVQTINVAGQITATAGDGVNAFTFGSGKTDITTAGVTATGTGISAVAFGGAGNITATTTGAVIGDFDADGVGDGIALSSNGGNVTANVGGTVSGANGVFLLTNGAGNATVNGGVAGNTITGTAGDGINATAATGTITIGSGPGTRLQQAVLGTDDAISATGAGDINVFTAGNLTGDTDASGAGDGVRVTSTGAAGKLVTVDTAGGAIKAGENGIAVTSGAATVSITNTDGVEVSGGAGILLAGGAGSATITNSGNIDQTAFGKTGDFGINAATTTGQLTIVNKGNIGAAGAGNGIDVDGILANSASTSTLSITNSGNIFADTGADAGIKGVNTVGSASLVNTGTIDPANFGIFMSSAKTTTVDDSGNVEGNTGIHADSTSASGADNVTVLVKAPATLIKGDAGNGIEAFMPNGTGTVNVGTAGTRIAAAVTGVGAGSNGIFAQGKGDVNVFTGASTITGGASGAAWGIKAVSNPGGAGAGGAVTVNTQGLVTGAQGILASANGTDAGDTATVTVGGNVTSTAGKGVQASAVNGLAKIDLNTGLVVATGGDGLLGTSTGTGGVTINTAVGTEVRASSAGFNDIKATTSGASGDINVTNLGGLNIGGFAGNDGIFAAVTNAASTSNINISNQGYIDAATAGQQRQRHRGDQQRSGGDQHRCRHHQRRHGDALRRPERDQRFDHQCGQHQGHQHHGGEAAGPLAFVNQSFAGGAGIAAKNFGTGATNVTVASGSSIEADGTGTNGIDAEAATGPVTVTTNGGNSITAGFDDILASSFGAVSVTNSFSLLGATDAGIRVSAGAGQVDVTNTGDASTLANASLGIVVLDTTGKITVTNSGQIGAAGAGNGVNAAGIAAISSGANSLGITVNNSAAIFVDNGGIAGILATNAGTGDVVVNNSGVIDPPAFGIFVSSGGSATANTSANVTGNTGIHADSSGVAGKAAQVNVTGGAVVTGATLNGIEVATTKGANAGVNTTAGGNVVGGTNGVSSSVTGAGTTGATTINTLTSTNSTLIKSVTGNGGDGIVATTTGSGAMSITTGNVTGAGAAGGVSSGIKATSSGGSAITVATTGTVSGDAAGNAGVVGGTGITATSSGGNGNVTVTSNPTTNVVGGSVNGGNAGIVASSAGTGSTTVNANVAVNGTGAATVNTATGPVGISATGGTGGVTVNVGAVQVQAANGRGIVTSTSATGATAGQINIAAGGSVRGLGSDATHAVIDITNTSVTGRTVVNNAGLIQSINAVPAAFGDLAITGADAAASTTGGVTINNAATGVINGRLVFSGLTGTANLALVNAAGGQWHSTGTSTFGPGADSIVNSGVIATNNAGTATTIDFGAGADSFTNNAGGVLVAGEGQLAASASNLTLTGLETFTNNGLVVFGGTTTTSDNGINDKINAAGALFGGTGKLAMDADLFSTAQASCASLTAADCLAVGSTTGLNSIVVNDNNAHAVGAFNPNGIALVTGSTNAGANFKLDPTSEWYNPSKFGGVLDKPGLFFYDLAWSAANGGTSLLIGVPDTEAFELSEIGAQSMDVWYASTQTWFDRQADLRVTLAGRAEGWAPAVWLKVMGQWTDRDNTATFSLFNKSYSFDVGYRQDTTGLIGGVDVLRGSNGTEGYVFGVQGGYMDSDVRFHSPSRAKLSGPTFGVYGTYMNGGFFLDGIVNANFLNLDVDMPTLPTPPNPFSTSADVRSYGGQLETGYQMALGSNGFWEPIASLSYVHTDIHDMSLGSSGLVTFPTTTSFRGSLGLRLGMTGDFQYYRVRATLTGRYIDEFDGTNDIVIVSGGPSNLALSDGLNGGFGEVGLGTNLFATGGHLSAFANANVRFQSNYQSTSVTAGFRYQW